jgi:methionyl-tRNA synthetase
MLKAAGIPLYRQLYVHGYWNVEETKMSKSLGNVVDPLELKNVYSADAFRYFLMREMAFGLDSSFSEKALIQRINSDLANDLGNLFSRSLTMVHKYFEGVVPKSEGVALSDLDTDLRSVARHTAQNYREAMEEFAFHKALICLWEFINGINKYIDTTAPWELAKKESQRKQLALVLYNILEGLRVIAGLLYPFMPRASQVMQEHLGLEHADTLQRFEDLKVWGKTSPETRLPKTLVLFPRIEEGKGQATHREPAQPEEALAPMKGEISVELFQKMDLRVATVLHAEPVPRAKRLVKLKVDAGEERTVVAGIAESYQPEELLGKQVVIVANLKPAKLMGILSQGMVLAATDKGTCRLLTVDGPSEPGTTVT